MIEEEITIKAHNYGTGDAGNRILDLALDTDLTLVAAWETPDGGGNCYFATVQMMANLLQKGAADGFMIVTGVFRFPDLPKPVVHCWLEKSGIVLNVSNLSRRRPVYVKDRATYYRHNNLERRIQKISPRRVREMLKACDGDVRIATKRLLKPTFNVRAR
jgi:hypothetical protein